MREINNRFKFKAFHHDSGEMIEEGSLGDVFRWLNDGQDITICQSTNLTDKNGVEIFEGYVINIRGNNYLVIYDGPVFTLIDKNNNNYDAGDYYCGEFAESYNWESLEVIGNKYSNPELMGSNND